jgi:hypothetical protein
MLRFYPLDIKKEWVTEESPPKKDPFDLHPHRVELSELLEVLCTSFDGLDVTDYQALLTVCDNIERAVYGKFLNYNGKNLVITQFLLASCIDGLLKIPHSNSHYKDPVYNDLYNEALNYSRS